jgi:hypothetical protein
MCCYYLLTTYTSAIGCFIDLLLDNIMSGINYHHQNHRHQAYCDHSSVPDCKKGESTCDEMRCVSVVHCVSSGLVGIGLFTVTNLPVVLLCPSRQELRLY